MLDNKQNESIVSGRAILSRMEGEFTRISQIYGNVIIFYGAFGGGLVGARLSLEIKEGWLKILIITLMIGVAIKLFIDSLGGPF